MPEPATNDLPIETSNFTRAEVDAAIDSLHSNKSPGIDSCIVSEILKNGGEFIRSEIHQICSIVYEKHEAPKQWTSNLIVPIPKKGNPQLMGNYRGISLMSIAAKVYNKILFNRIVPIVDGILRRNQAGFRKNRSCTQQIHILRRIIEGATAKQIPFFITFIDFKKAFDSISRDVMFAILRNYGVPYKIVQAIKVLYDDSTSQVYVNGKLSKEFKVTTGVLQGDVLAPSLFIIVIDYVMKRSEKEFGFITHLRTCRRNLDKKLNDLDYADDIALLEKSLSAAQQQLEETSKNAREVGLEINTDKTKLMIFNSDQNQTIKLNGEIIETVSDFKYLGSHMESSEKDFKIRKGQAWGAFWLLKNIWKSRETSVELKIRIFEASCLSILLYGSETWILTERLKAELDSFGTKCYRQILGIRKRDRISNEKIYERVKQRPLSNKLLKRQLTWVGHILRYDSNEPVRIYGLYEPSRQLCDKFGKVKAGKPKMSYASYISGLITKDISFLAEEIERKAQDRSAWKIMIEHADMYG